MKSPTKIRYHNTFEVIDVEAVSVPQVLITVNRGLHDASIAINFEYLTAHIFAYLRQWKKRNNMLFKPWNNALEEFHQ